MPEFHIVVTGPVGDIDYFNLDAFTQGYIEALFFTETSPAWNSGEWHSEECRAAQEEGTADGSIPGDTGFEDLSAETLAEIISDCRKFQEVNAELLARAYERNGYDESRAGNDFWYTRNGHGVGFWDRGLGDVGDQLSECCGWESRNSENPFTGVDAFYSEAGKVCLA